MPVRAPYPKEVELLERAVEALHAATGFNVDIEGRDLPVQQGRRADALVRLRAHGVDQKLVVEVKQPLTTATLGVAVQQLNTFEQRGMIVTDYVNPPMAERLREMDIFFIDTAGNVYVHIPPVFVFIKGNRRPDREVKELKTRAFQPAGLKVIFTLLCEPDLVPAPYRDIEKMADVALGTVAHVVNDLKRLGYLVERGQRGRRLVNRKELVERWVTNYPEQLRPKLLLGKCGTTNDDWWRHADLGNFKAYWGGEVAAAKLTKYLKPQFFTIYVREETAKLELAHKLRKDPKGKVELLRAFWDTKLDQTDQRLVPTLLAYADLLAIGDPRDIETATLIYERELAGLVGKD